MRQYSALQPVRLINIIVIRFITEITICTFSDKYKPCFLEAYCQLGRLVGISSLVINMISCSTFSIIGIAKNCAFLEKAIHIVSLPISFGDQKIHSKVMAPNKGIFVGAEYEKIVKFAPLLSK